MPRDYHPCFRSQLWTNGDQAVLTFDSDGHTYLYTSVPAPIWDTFQDGSLTGEQWNASIRGAIGPFIRIN